MIRHILKRLLFAIPLLFGIATATFFMMQLAPGDPLDMYLEPQRQRQVDPEIIELLREKYGLDQPIHVQYVRWLGNVMRAGPGRASRHGRPVRDVRAEAVPYARPLRGLGGW